MGLKSSRELGAINTFPSLPFLSPGGPKVRCPDPIVQSQQIDATPQDPFILVGGYVWPIWIGDQVGSIISMCDVCS